MCRKAKNKSQSSTQRPIVVVFFIFLITNIFVMEVNGDHIDNDINWSLIPRRHHISNLQSGTDASAGTDMTPSASSIPGLDAVRGFFSQNIHWITPLLAAVPSKVATYMTVRALRQQRAQQQQLRLQNLDNVVALRPQEGQRGAEQDDDNCVDDNCDDMDDSEPKDKRSFMMFLGKGNIQVKNHKGDDYDSDYNDQKSVTYQKIDLEHNLMNKHTPPRLDRLRRLIWLRSGKKSISSTGRAKKSKKY